MSVVQQAINFKLPDQLQFHWIKEVLADVQRNLDNRCNLIMTIMIFSMPCNDLLSSICLTLHDCYSPFAKHGTSN